MEANDLNPRAQEYYLEANENDKITNSTEPLLQPAGKMQPSDSIIKPIVEKIISGNRSLSVTILVEEIDDNKTSTVKKAAELVNDKLLYADDNLFSDQVKDLQNKFDIFNVNNNLFKYDTTTDEKMKSITSMSRNQEIEDNQHVHTLWEYNGKIFFLYNYIHTRHLQYFHSIDVKIMTIDQHSSIN